MTTVTAERDDTAVQAAVDDLPAAEKPEIEPIPEAPPTATVALRTPRGSLTIRPDQKELDEEQTAALLAIGIDADADPGVLPHLRAFLHMCQIRDLDPFAKEAYLIGRGQGTDRKYTMQVSIDGFRKIAGDTGRFIRRVGWFWTGTDDGDHTWRFDPTTGIMRRIWFDEWPERRGWPGAARCIIEHYDEAGNVVTTDAVAHWSMYAPLVPKWTWGQRRGEKVYEYDAAGNKVMELSDMWAKGYHHMLAKCSEALVVRTAFPRQTSGMYVFEEMARADQEERERLEVERSRARREAYRVATQPAIAGEVVASTQPQQPATPTDPPHSPPPVEKPETGDPASPPPLDPPAQADVETVDEPAAVGETLSDVVAELANGPVDDDTRRGWLMEEIGMQAETLGGTVEVLTRRYVDAAGKPLAEFTVAELESLRERNRRQVVNRLRKGGREPAADTYAASEGITAPLAILLGG
jgi:RecT family